MGDDVNDVELSVVVGINIFLAFFLLLKLLAHFTPSSSSIPLLGQLLQLVTSSDGNLFRHTGLTNKNGAT